MKTQIELVHLQITKNCNLRCWFCGQWGKKGFFADDKGELLSLNKWLDIINELENYGKKVNKLPDVMLWGGEPLVSPYFTTILKTLNQKGFKVGMVTNGVHINDYISLINECVSVMYVSIDGDKNTHDEIRGSGVFDKVISNLKLVSNNVKIRVMSVITPKLLENFTLFTNVLSTANIEKLILQEMIYLTPSEAENYKNRLNSAFNQNADYIESWVSNPPNLREKTYQLLKGNYNVNIEFLPHNVVSDRSCLSSYKHIHIAWNGNVLFCTDFYDFSAGNVLNDTVENIFNGSLAQKFRNEISKCDLETCKHCSWKNSNSFYFN